MFTAAQIALETQSLEKYFGFRCCAETSGTTWWDMQVFDCRHGSPNNAPTIITLRIEKYTNRTTAKQRSAVKRQLVSWLEGVRKNAITGYK